MIVGRVFDLLLKATRVEEKVLHSEAVIRTLKAVNLDPDHPPIEFDGVYAYALVEYAYDEQGQRKHSALIRLFRTETVKQSFRQALDNDAPGEWLSDVSQQIEQGDLGRELRELGCDIYAELIIFARFFFEIVKRSRMPKEVLADQKLDSLQQQMQQMQQQIQQLPFLEIQKSVTRLTGALDLSLPASREEKTGRQYCQAAALANQLQDWFKVLGYGFEKAHELWTETFFEFLITIPVRRKRYDRIVVRGIAGAADLADVQALYQSVGQKDADEGWLVSNRRVTPAARRAVSDIEEYEQLSCYTFDELLDEDANFENYIAWLESEIQAKAIENRYVPLACTKAEVDPIIKQEIGISRYGEDEGWIEVYVDQWLDDPAKEHLSVLGEFGSGKTWFALHYAWLALEKYKRAKQRGTERPRLPLVIPLRDYAKSVNAESLFSEFFFRKHEIPLPGYSAFKQLNRMGKLLLIFDGFDEMAARVDRQAMINNFWELAKVVVPGSKAILTCRTEHFPEAKESRQLLNAELRASTQELTGETPQFEVLELEKFSNQQIRKVLANQTGEETIHKVMDNSQLVDLARRPVLTEMIIEALPDIEAGKPIDMSRIYLYAVCNKMERDITSERTFTSMTDKLYFLSELSWEMLSTDRMSINYREFPKRIRQLFGTAVEEEKDLDHWHYDMMGQTMLIRNAEGDYTPAHRSLLEFFVAYKFAAELGVLAEDFIRPVQLYKEQTPLSQGANYTWTQYCLLQAQSGQTVSSISSFSPESIANLRLSVGKAALTKAVSDLIAPMISTGEAATETLFSLISSSRHKSEDEVGYLCGNITRILVNRDHAALEGRDFQNCTVMGADFSNASLRQTDFRGALTKDSLFLEPLCTVLDVKFSPDNKRIAAATARGHIKLWDVATGTRLMKLQGHVNWIRDIVFTPDGNRLISAGDDRTIRIWNLNSGTLEKTIRGHLGRIRSLSLAPDGQSFVSTGIESAVEALYEASDDYESVVKVWDLETGTCKQVIKGHTDWILAVDYSSNGNLVATGCRDSSVKIWDVLSGECIQTNDYHTERVNTVTFNKASTLLASAGDDKTILLYDLESRQLVHELRSHTDYVRSVCFSPDDRYLISGSYDYEIKVWDVASGACLRTLSGHSNWVRSVNFSSDGRFIASSGDDQTIKIWEASSGRCLRTLKGYSHIFLALAIHQSGQFFVTGSMDSTIRLWDIDTGTCIGSFESDSAWPNCLQFSPNGELLAIPKGSKNSSISLWNVKTGERIQHSFDTDNARARAILFLKDGKTMLSSGDDSVIRLWDTQNGDRIRTLEGHSQKVLSMALSPDESLLASAGEDCTTHLWDLKSYEIVKSCKAHTSGIWSLAFHPDGKRIASGSRDHNIKIWNIESEKDNILTLEGHADRVKSIAFSSDGQYLASGSHDRDVRIWHIDSGECLQVLKGHTNWVSAVQFTPDLAKLVSASEDGTIRIWDMASFDCIHVLKPHRPYEGMKISGVRGLAATELTALKGLGAVD